ncbi:unnamed protein product [Arctogadus glacialis]
MVTDEPPPSPRVNHFLKQMEARTDTWKDNQRMSSEPVPLTAEGLAAGPGPCWAGPAQTLSDDRTARQGPAGAGTGPRPQPGAWLGMRQTTRLGHNLCFLWWLLYYVTYVPQNKVDQGIFIRFKSLYQDTVTPSK